MDGASYATTSSGHNVRGSRSGDDDASANGPAPNTNDGRATNSRAHGCNTAGRQFR